MTLSGKIEDEIYRKFDVTTWDRLEEDSNDSQSATRPLRAIVKEYVENDVPFKEKNIIKMLGDLRRIRRHEIYNRDVTARNYRAGLLVDFSCAMTKPHYLFETRPKWQVAVYKRDDLLQFDEMIEESRLKTWVRATPNKEYKQKLRKRPPRPETSK